MKHRALTLALITIPLAGCQAYQTSEVETASASVQPDPPAFVEAACGGCHAVQPPFLSPNPQAPSFEEIANREGLSEDTLGTWLKDAHNYPEVMDFDLSAEQADEIAEYMITLRRGDYREVK